MTKGIVPVKQANISITTSIAAISTTCLTALVTGLRQWEKIRFSKQRICTWNFVKFPQFTSARMSLVRDRHDEIHDPASGLAHSMKPLTIDLSGHRFSFTSEIILGIGNLVYDTPFGTMDPEVQAKKFEKWGASIPRKGGA